MSPPSPLPVTTSAGSTTTGRPQTTGPSVTTATPPTSPPSVTTAGPGNRTTTTAAPPPFSTTTSAPSPPSVTTTAGATTTGRPQTTGPSVTTATPPSFPPSVTTTGPSVSTTTRPSITTAPAEQCFMGGTRSAVFPDVASVTLNGQLVEGFQQPFYPSAPFSVSTSDITGTATVQIVLGQTAPNRIHEILLKNEEVTSVTVTYIDGSSQTLLQSELRSGANNEKTAVLRREDKAVGSLTVTLQSTTGGNIQLNPLSALICEEVSTPSTTPLAGTSTGRPQTTSPPVTTAKPPATLAVIICDQPVGMGEYTDNIAVFIDGVDITETVLSTGRYGTTTATSEKDFYIRVVNIEGDVTVASFKVDILSPSSQTNISPQLVLLDDQGSKSATLDLQKVSTQTDTYSTLAGSIPESFTSGRMILRVVLDEPSSLTLSSLEILACFEPSEKVCTFTIADFEAQIGNFPNGEAIGYIEINDVPGYNEGDHLVSLEDSISDGVTVHVMCYECTCEDRTITCKETPNCTPTCDATEWSHWSACTKSCDVGEAVRTRQVVGSNPDCDNSEVDREPCNVHVCEEPPEWGTWTPWSDCSATNPCDTGMRVRTRQCLNDMCTVTEDSVEVEGCVAGENCLPACDPQMEEYNPCANAVCEDIFIDCFGVKQNFTCEAVEECVPGCLCKNELVRDENGNCVPQGSCGHCYGPDGTLMPEGERRPGLQPCEYCACENGQYVCNIDDTCCEVGPWGEWSPCMTECGTGERLRVRSVTAGCDAGDDKETEQCTGEPCKDCMSGGVWYEDGEEIPTSDACKKCYCDAVVRQMVCEDNPLANNDGQWSNWTPWSTCASECGTGERFRHRSCSNPEPQCAGRMCVGNETESAPCDLPSCCETGPWNEWSPCSVTCDGGARERSRDFTDPADAQAAECQGIGISESDTCNESPCDETCQIGPWSVWSDCSVSCGGGHKTRQRDTDCEVPSSESSDCNMEPCQDCGDTAEFREFTYCEQMTCQRYLAGNVGCNDNGTTYMGCVCSENYVMNAQDECVPAEECNMCEYNGTMYKEDEIIYSTECSHFICVKGSAVEVEACTTPVCQPGEVLTDVEGECCPVCKPVEETPDRCQERTKTQVLTYFTPDGFECVSDTPHTVTYCGGSCGNSEQMPMVYVEGDNGEHMASSCKCCTGEPGAPISVSMTCKQGRTTKDVTAFFQNVSNCSCDQCVGNEISVASMGLPN